MPRGTEALPGEGAGHAPQRGSFLGYPSVVNGLLLYVVDIEEPRQDFQ